MTDEQFNRMKSDIAGLILEVNNPDGNNIFQHELKNELLLLKSDIDKILAEYL